MLLSHNVDVHRWTLYQASNKQSINNIHVVHFVLEMRKGERREKTTRSNDVNAFAPNGAHAHKHNVKCKSKLNRQNAVCVCLSSLEIELWSSHTRCCRTLWSVTATALLPGCYTAKWNYARYYQLFLCCATHAKWCRWNFVKWNYLRISNRANRA